MSEGKARGRSIYCAPETQAAMHEQAREADMPLSRLVVELARADDPDRHALRDELAECAELAPGAAGMRGGQWHSFWRSRRRLFLSLS